MRGSLLFAATLASTILAGTAIAHAKVNVTIDLSSQRMHVTSSSGSYTWKVSTGVGRYHTPRGTYRPYLLKRMHYSRKYDNSPMPHSIFFRGGYAIHGTNSIRRLGTPASHGCIRLAPGNAATLFRLVKKEGAQISIIGSRETFYARHGKQPSKQYARKKTKKTIVTAERTRSKKTYASAAAKKKHAATQRHKQRTYAVSAGRGAPPMAYAPRSEPTGIFTFFRNPRNTHSNR